VRPGRHAEIVPKDGSHCVLVDGMEWSRHDDLAKAEAVREAIVDRWADWYEEKAASYVQLALFTGSQGRDDQPI
jgi:hypothetical protein